MAVIDDYSADSKTSATLFVGGVASGVIETAGDADWFRVQLLAGVNYEFTLGGALAGAARFSDIPALQLYDATVNGFASVQTVNLGGAPVVRFKPSTSGAYFLDVAGGSGLGAYSVGAVALAKDDHADGVATLDALPLGGQAGGVIEVVGDRDAFIIPVEAGKTYTVSVAGVASAGVGAALPVVGVYSSASAFPQSVTGVADGTASSFTATTTGNYYAIVHDVDSRHGSGAYVLNFAAAVDDYAANAAGAGNLVLGGAIAHGALEVGGDRDWFKISLPAGQVALLLGDGTGHLSATMLDASGAFLINASPGGSGNATLVWTVPRAADYYVEVHSQTNYAAYPTTSNYTGAYTLQAAPVPADDFSADIRTTGLLSDGATLSGRLAGPADSDWIKVQLKAGVNYAFGVTSTAALGDGGGVIGALTLLNASGQTVKGASAIGGADPLLIYQTASAGDYFLVVANGATIGSNYRLTSYAQPADAIAADASTSATLAPGQLLTGVIETPIDRDWFQVTLSAAQSYTFAVSGALAGDGTLGADGNIPTLVLFNAAGVQQVTGSASLGVTTLSYYAGSAGTFYVQVGASALGTGSYTLREADNSHPLADNHAPRFVSLAGPTLAGGTGANLVVTFDETVARGDGSITLRLASGAVVETFDAKTSAHLGFAGRTLTLDPSADLAPGTNYVLELGGASVSDSSGNGYAATTTHALRTADAGAQLQGGAGNDVFIATAGNDVINGGAGTDTVVYAGLKSDYTITQGIAGNLVSAVGGTQSKDILTSVERIVFDNGAIAFDIEGTAGQVYRLYQAAFGRTPDVAGVGYWIGQADKGMGMSAVAAGFVASKEFATLYGAGLSDAQFVTQVYQNVLHRAPDAVGLSYWSDALAHGSARSDALIAFSESAENQVAMFAAMDVGISYTPFL